MAAFSGSGASAVTNQLPYNLLWRAIESGILPSCAAQGVGVLCYSPLQQALLTGKYLNSEEVPEGRRRCRLFASDSTPTSRHVRITYVNTAFSIFVCVSLTEVFFISGWSGCGG